MKFQQTLEPHTINFTFHIAGIFHKDSMESLEHPPGPLSAPALPSLPLPLMIVKAFLVAAICLSLLSLLLAVVYVPSIDSKKALTCSTTDVFSQQLRCRYVSGLFGYQSSGETRIILPVDDATKNVTLLTVIIGSVVSTLAFSLLIFAIKSRRIRLFWIIIILEAIWATVMVPDIIDISTIAVIILAMMSRKARQYLRRQDQVQA